MNAQRHNAQCCLTGYRLALRAAFFLIVSCVLPTAPVLAQTQPTPSRDATPEAAREERELNEARRSNEKAQAEYYRAQTEKLQQPNPPKTFWRALSDNAAILGALTAALVALFTLVVNQRTALRGRKDTEFYEALKRFGDKDSPTVRASAVAMLAEMSNISFFAWRWRKKAPWWRPDQNMIRYPYFETVLDQLVTGLLLEENSVVIHAIVAALDRILPRNFKRAAEQLRAANLKLQDDLMPHLTEFFVARGATKPDQVREEVWKEATNLTRCSLEGLKVLMAKYSSWEETDEIEDDAQRRLRMIEINSSLMDVGRRLSQNVELCRTLLRARPKSEIEPLDFSHAYLANLGLWKSNLRNTDFRRALMPQVTFSESNLGGAIFEDTIVEGALFSRVELTDTKLFDARIDRSNPPFFEANWWRADYVNVWWRDFNSGPTVDEDLIEKLIVYYGELSPEKLKEAHASVKAYVAKRNASRDDAAAKLK